MSTLIPGYLHLTLSAFNAFVVSQLLIRFLYPWIAIEQWILLGGILLLFLTGLVTHTRKNAQHFSPHEASLYQFLFFILTATTVSMLGLLLLSDPLLFMIFMPFEFFIMLFLVLYYFLLTRFTFPHKKHNL